MFALIVKRGVNGFMPVLPVRFYERSPEEVARGLLGKKLVRRLSDMVLEGVIVEDEAYCGWEDPASRAHRGVKPHNRGMWGPPGRALIYNVHNNWMFNVVAHEPGGVGAVLMRAVEPRKGLEIMRERRGVEDPCELTNGPGKLARAFMIDKTLNNVDLTSEESEVFIAENKLAFEVETSHRIGVKRDLERELRFYVRGNRFVSKKLPTKHP